jgi:hypothetical protein
VVLYARVVLMVLYLDAGELIRCVRGQRVLGLYGFEEFYASHTPHHRREACAAFKDILDASYSRKYVKLANLVFGKSLDSRYAFNFAYMSQIRHLHRIHNLYAIIKLPVEAISLIDRRIERIGVQWCWIDR